MAGQPSPAPARAGTVAITALLAKEVRNRLKKLAIDLERTMNHLIAEALEDVFAKLRSPRSASKGK